MSSWINIYFINANSPIIEQIIIFHDQSIILITSIIIFLVLTLINLSKNNKLFINLSENQFIETLWTIIPMILLFFIAIPRLQILYLIEETYNPHITIKITGHQWYWTYEYRNFNLNTDSFISPTNIINLKNFRLLESDTPVIIPLNLSTRALVSRADVIHSWTIQRLGVKTDAIPGRLNQINLTPSRPGIFFGQCSEICGANHSFIPIIIKITPLNSYKKYIKNLI